MSPPALSRHLRVLKACGLVADNESEHDARVRLYLLQLEGFETLGQWVDDFRSLWTDLPKSKNRDSRQRSVSSKPTISEMPGFAVICLQAFSLTPHSTRFRERLEFPVESKLRKSNYVCR